MSRAAKTVYCSCCCQFGVVQVSLPPYLGLQISPVGVFEDFFPVVKLLVGLLSERSHTHAPRSQDAWPFRSALMWTRCKMSHKPCLTS